MYYIVGLGNPDGRYDSTRHNVGRDIVKSFLRKHNFSEFTFDKKSNSLISEGKVGKNKVTLILPETFMNDSGKAINKLITSKKKIHNTIIVYDELDMPLGSLKIAFNRGSGGHRGVESIIKHLKTKEFIRLRVGISPSTQSGKLKKPKGDDKVKKYVLSPFSPKEKLAFTKIKKKAVEALDTILDKGFTNASNEVNSWK